MNDPIFTGNQVVIEEQQVSEYQDKVDKLFNNIQDSKRKKKEVQTLMKSELLSNDKYSSLLEEKKELDKQIKEAKQAAVASSRQFNKLAENLEELNNEIKNDTEILNEFIVNAKPGEQLRLFDFAEDREYKALPNYLIKPKDSL